ncbi:hypothetical protein [Pedobacter agri]|uniref:hypothetical protein n=1 Tax=Pedobacter agri TaxID=454586 RepID=UPI0027894F40|nr:hypothetical protein [Pedobacter agri]MDQ1142947.1 hypothetical protein [Pedobacter agri]
MKVQKGNELRVSFTLYDERIPGRDKGEILFVRQKDILPIKKQTVPHPYYRASPLKRTDKENLNKP